MLGARRRVLCLLLLGLARSSALGQATPSGVDSIVAKLSCSSFDWEPWEGVSDKGAIKVPITFGGRQYWFQLDTGADVTSVYGKPDPALSWREGQNSVRVTDVALGGMKWSARRFLVLPDMKPGATSGTVGLDVMMGNVAVIDYPGKRFCLVPHVDAPSELWTKSRGVKAVIRDGKFFVEAQLNSRALDGLFFDTGSSALALSVDFEEWKAITGLTGENQAAQKVAGFAWGKPMTFIGGESSGDLLIGSLNLGRQLAFYRSEPWTSSSSSPFTPSETSGTCRFSTRS